MPIRVLLVDDHPLVRDGVRALLASSGDVRIVGEAGDGMTAVRLAAELTPDVVVMDLRLPDMNGVEAVTLIRRQSPGVRVVVMSAHADRRTADAATSTGASSVLPKDAAFEELADAVRAAAAGHAYESPTLSQIIARD